MVFKTKKMLAIVGALALGGSVLGVQSTAFAAEAPDELGSAQLFVEGQPVENLEALLEQSS